MPGWRLCQFQTPSRRLLPDAAVAGAGPVCKIIQPGHTDQALNILVLLFPQPKAAHWRAFDALGLFFVSFIHLREQCSHISYLKAVEGYKAAPISRPSTKVGMAPFARLLDNYQPRREFASLFCRECCCLASQSLASRQSPPPGRGIDG